MPMSLVVIASSVPAILFNSAFYFFNTNCLEEKILEEVSALPVPLSDHPVNVFQAEPSLGRSASKG
jgi:hypothetical protein